MEPAEPREPHSSPWSVWAAAPTAPPDPWSPPPPPPPEHPEPHRSGGGRRFVGVLVVLAVLAAAGAGVLVGRGLSDDGRDATPRAATEAAGETATTMPGPIEPGTEEPIAAVAEALSPAVVQIETSQGLGSGFVYDAEGLILTAAHVTDASQEVRVTFADGSTVAGEVLGEDLATDVAVIRIDAGGDLAVAELGTGVDLRVGQTAVAIGSPFGLDQSVTSGIISALGRTTQTPGGAVPAIQTDAPINSGNSGGALADLRGRVIGINDSIITGNTGGGGNVGIGFAIPIDIAKVVADRIVAGEPTESGFLGVRGGDAAGNRSGALLVEVEDGSPAARAGLRSGDLVIAVDGNRVGGMIDLQAQISTRRPGDRVQVTFMRDGDEQEADVQLGSSPGS